MLKTKINLCSHGEPTDIHTWSGTPFHIYTELIKRDQCSVAFNADPPKGLRKILSLLTFCFYGKTDINRSPINRYASAFNVSRQTRRSSSSHTLHMGALALPFFTKPQNQWHYLFCDSTWHLWSNNATNINTYSKNKLALFEQLERRAFLQMSHIFSISQYVKNDLMNHYNIAEEKITIVGTGLGRIKPFYGEKDYSNRKILFVSKGRFRDKGGELVIDAFQKALKIDPELKLTIVAGEEAKKFESNLNITILGFIPHEKLQKLFDTHSVFLMPAFNEPWGLVFLEAMACKMPIVGLRRNSFPELSAYGKYGFNIEEADPKIIADVLVDIFKHPIKSKKMGKNAQMNCLKQFSWKNTVDRIIEVIERKQYSA